MAITGQKLGGPRGAGVLWVAPGLRLAPLLGGEQERGRRGGTENLPGIAGLAAALSAAVRGRQALEARLLELRRRLERRAAGRRPRRPRERRRRPAPRNASSVTFPGADAEALLMALDLEGLCASAGAACHSGSTSPSGVLLAMGMHRGRGPLHPALLARLEQQRRRGGGALALRSRPAGGPRPRRHPGRLATPAPNSPLTTAAMASGVPTAGS